MSSPTILPKIFISYAEENIEDAEKLKSLLDAEASKAGDAVPEDWIYLARRSNEGGDDWRNKLYRELKERPVFLLLISPACLESRWCLTQEAWVAWHYGVRFIPVVLDGRSAFRLTKLGTWFRRHTDWEKALIRASTETDFLLWWGRQQVDENDDIDRSFRLNARHALPIGSKPRQIVCPIRTNPDLFWPLAVDQILKAILADGARQPAALYACDQGHLRSTLPTRFKNAGGKPLILLLQGDEDDDLGKFWKHWVAQEARSGSIPDAARGERPLKVDLDWSQEEITNAVQNVISETPQTGPCFLRWQVGTSGTEEEDRQLTAALRSIGKGLSDRNRTRGVTHPLIVCSILLESNRDVLDSLQKDLRQTVSGIHVETLPRLKTMNHKAVDEWVKDLAEPPATDAFKQRADELVKGLQTYSGAVRFRRFEQLCRKHRLILDQP